MRKEIIIKTNDRGNLSPETRELLLTAIAEAEGRAKERTISPDIIFSELSQVQQWLQIPKKSMENLEVKVDSHAQKFPNAYRYMPYSTQFNAIFRRGRWRIVSVGRYGCGTRAWTIYHTDESKAAIIARYSVR